LIALGFEYEIVEPARGTARKTPPNGVASTLQAQIAPMRAIAFEFVSPAAGARLLLNKLGPIPRGKSLDRIDPAGPYSLDNLRYATPLLQVLNRRTRSSVRWMKNNG